jgi:hypothetical protein
MAQIIMIVKGNMRQVTFLHVYHHVSISLIWYEASLPLTGAWFAIISSGCESA